MARYYEVYKSLILAITFSGIYFSSIEKIYGEKFYIKCLKILCILPGICMPLHLGSAIKYLLFDANDERSRIFGSAVIVFSFFVFFTFYSFYYLRHEFERLFELWDSMFQEEPYPEHRQELLMKNRNLTIKWLKRFGSVITSSCFGYCIVMYFNPSKKLSHPSGFPYRHESPDFELVNTLDLIVSSFGCSGNGTKVYRTMVNAPWCVPNHIIRRDLHLPTVNAQIGRITYRFIAFDSMTMAFISMEEAQLQHLKISLAWIVDTVSVTDSGNIQIKTAEINVEQPDSYQMTKTFEELRKQIRIWIIHHQQVLRFHYEFQKVYSIPLSVRFLYFVFILCLTCFLMLAGELTPLDIAFTIQYFFNNYTIFYVIVTYADTVIEVVSGDSYLKLIKGSTIFDDALEKSWHLYPKELKTMFHIIQMQSNRPLHYLAFKKYSLSSGSFLKMLSSTYSLFTFMLQTNRKKV